MNDSAEQPRPQSVSTVLSTRREALGLTQKQVADELFLTAIYISHIDEGRFEQLPNPAYIKGYLRSYARLVEIDGDQIVAAYEAEYDHPDEPELRDVSDEEVGPAVFTGPVLTTGIAGLGVTLVLVLLVWWLVGDDEPPQDFTMVSETAVIDNQPTDLSAQGISDNPAAFAELETILIDRSDASNPDVTEPDPTITNVDPLTDVINAEPREDDVNDRALVTDNGLQTSDSASSDVVVAEMVGTFTEISVDRRVESGVRYVDVNAGGPDELSFTFSGECWLKVSDADGRQLYADLNRDGDVLSVRGKGHFTILLGRGSVVSIELNGDVVDVDPYIRDDETARIRTQHL
ncbi:MAG: RodZ domain-containing protein [Pseudomonadota bacterium]